MKNTDKQVRERHKHKIATDNDGKRIIDDNGYYVCECGATTFPNCGWFEPKQGTSYEEGLEIVKKIEEKLEDTEDTHTHTWASMGVSQSIRGTIIVVTHCVHCTEIRAKEVEVQGV